MLAGLILLATLSSPAHSAGQGELPAACPNPAVAAVLAETPNRDLAHTTLLARKFDARQRSVAEATGNVELRRADQLLQTELLRYLPADRRVEIPLFRSLIFAAV